MNEHTINCKELGQVLGNPELILLDVRFSLTDPGYGRAAYAKAHIPGARFTDLKSDVCGVVTEKSGRSPFPLLSRFVEKMRSLGVSNDSFVVAYDDGSLNGAARVWFTLRTAGFSRVKVLDGGYAAWCRNGLPVTADVPAVASGNLTQGEPLECVVRLDRVKANLLTKNFLLIDARTHDRYLGQNETTDKKAGHIPGSLSHPSAGNFTSEKILKAPETLKREFAPYFATGKPVVNSCGSGLSACCNHLAQRIAGLSPAGIYIGSWSEWITEEGNPVATAEETLG